MACDCDKPECNNGYNCHWLEAGNCFFCHCNDLDPNDSDYVEVKAWADSVDAGDARDFVDQGVIGLMCTGEITSNAKKILGYKPKITINEGLNRIIKWNIKNK